MSHHDDVDPSGMGETVGRDVERDEDPRRDDEGRVAAETERVVRDAAVVQTEGDGVSR